MDGRRCRRCRSSVIRIAGSTADAYGHGPRARRFREGHDTGHTDRYCECNQANQKEPITLELLNLRLSRALPTVGRVRAAAYLQRRERMVDLLDGEAVEIQGTASRPYVLKNIGGVYSCSCPAWRN
jgi:hypothetical protein